VIGLLAIVDDGYAQPALQCSGFKAVLGAAPLPLSEAALRAHEAVVRSIAGRAQACLPARFGSSADSEAALRTSLEQRGDELRQALELVRGREQMTLRVLGERAVAAPASGTQYLEQRLKLVRLPELDPLREALKPFVRAEKLEPHDQPGLLASVYHLIDRGSSADYTRALEAVELFELRVKPSGPWPAWSFAPEVAP
jgi:hypothetical protein